MRPAGPLKITSGMDRIVLTGGAIGAWIPVETEECPGARPLGMSEARRAAPDDERHCYHDRGGRFQGKPYEGHAGVAGRVGCGLRDRCRSDSD